MKEWWEDFHNPLVKGVTGFALCLFLALNFPVVFLAMLLTKNVNPKVVSEMLGHSSIAITLDTYSHVLPNMQDSAARALEEALR
jgi:hypothetical protein